uniref:Uncharacterized protein n=1 Tax=Amphimedon queenslandica TaxID=400682 RepID=A0A1X7UDJ6_AMPQE
MTWYVVQILRMSHILESNDKLATGGFYLRKFITNNLNLQNKINEGERDSHRYQ